MASHSIMMRLFPRSSQSLIRLHTIYFTMQRRARTKRAKVSPSSVAIPSAFVVELILRFVPCPRDLIRWRAVSKSWRIACWQLARQRLFVACHFRDFLLFDNSTGELVQTFQRSFNYLHAHVSGDVLLFLGNHGGLSKDILLDVRALPSFESIRTFNLGELDRNSSLALSCALVGNDFYFVLDTVCFKLDLTSGRLLWKHQSAFQMTNVIAMPDQSVICVTEKASIRLLRAHNGTELASYSDFEGRKYFDGDDDAPATFFARIAAGPRGPIVALAASQLQLFSRSSTATIECLAKLNVPELDGYAAHRMWASNMHAIVQLLDEQQTSFLVLNLETQRVLHALRGVREGMPVYSAGFCGRNLFLINGHVSSPSQPLLPSFQSTAWDVLTGRIVWAQTLDAQLSYMWFTSLAV